MRIEVQGEVITLADTLARQLPFATALALTHTAQDAQGEIRKLLPQQFKLKNTWTMRNIRIIAARKNNLTAVITAPDYMAKQETGGTLTPESSDHLAGPTNILRGKRITRGMKPSVLLGRDDTFKYQGASGSYAIAQRVGRKGKKIRILWWLTETQDYKERFHMADTVERVVNQRFAMRLTEALQRAVDTA